MSFWWKFSLSSACIALLLAAPSYGEEPSYKLIDIKSKDNTVNVSYPKLSGLADHAVEAKLNKAIMAEANEWKCDGDTQTGKAQFHVMTEVTQLTQTVFSYKLNFDYYCGGPYPDSHAEGRNFNLVTGEALTLDELLPAMDSKAISAAFLKDAAIEDECRDSYDENVTYEFFINPKGVVVFPQFPHVIQACVEEITFPLAKKTP